MPWGDTKLPPDLGRNQWAAGRCRAADAEPCRSDPSNLAESTYTRRSRVHTIFLAKMRWITIYKGDYLGNYSTIDHPIEMHGALQYGRPSLRYQWQ